MTKTLIVGIVLFIITTFVFWKITIGEIRREYGGKEWKVWGANIYYWQGALIFSGLITFLILLLLDYLSVLTL
jgi:hypothetical protein